MKWKLFATVSLILFAAETAFLIARAATTANVHASVTATPAVSVLTQGAYRWYANVDALDPTTPLAAEDTAIDAQAAGTQLRLRMNVANTGDLALGAGATFVLQYANATSGPWTDVSATTSWAFFNNPSVADGQIIVNLLLASSTVGESYDESNPSAAMPTQLLSGDYGEWDWVLVNDSAATSQNWFFRMENASGKSLDSYAAYPELTAVTPSGGGTTGGSGSVVQVGGGGGAPVASASSSTLTSVPSVPSVPPVQPGEICPLPTGQPTLPPKFQVADFNCDGRIDITDLSIMLYYYSECGAAVSRYDLNHDGCVDFPDISILMYYWTG